MHYIISDVHGHYKTLLALIEQLPNDATLIFVGDLIDRGNYSKEVIEYVKENKYQCVLGNHEDFMISYGTSFTKTYPKSTNPTFLHTWYNNGGTETLMSYGLIKYGDRGGLECVDDPEGFKQFQKDIEWLKTLPLYIELPLQINSKPVVISHASCANAWWQHNNPNGQETFREYALWHRQPPRRDSEIYNIYGHTPEEFGPEIEDHYCNIDTGVYIKKHGYGLLTAFCVEEQEVIQQRNID